MMLGHVHNSKYAQALRQLIYLQYIEGKFSTTPASGRQAKKQARYWLRPDGQPLKTWHPSSSWISRKMDPDWWDWGQNPFPSLIIFERSIPAGASLLGTVLQAGFCDMPTKHYSQTTRCQGQVPGKSTTL